MSSAYLAYAPMVNDSEKWHFPSPSTRVRFGAKKEAWFSFRGQVANYLQVVLDFCTSKFKIEFDGIQPTKISLRLQYNLLF